MNNQAVHAETFADLHTKNSPLILFNVWDPGSATVVAAQGAKAIGLGSHGVAEAFGYEDGEKIPLELVLENARRVVTAVDLPVTLDFEAGYGSTPSDVKASVLQALETGIIGLNIEDKISHGDGLYEIDDQVARLKAVKAAANDYGVKVFLNARTDIFKETDPTQHDQALITAALERAHAFASAGADSFFAPLIVKAEHMRIICEQSPLPVNIIWLPGKNMPTPEEIAQLGVSRISYGPGPWLQMKKWLGEQAAEAFSIQK